MKTGSWIKNGLMLLAIGMAFASRSDAQQNVMITVENLQPSDGFYFTPVWLGFHDGSFDYFDAGAQASANLEALAEMGDFSGIDSDFSNAMVGQSTVLFDSDGFPNAPVFDPGNSQSTIVSLGSSERYLSFGSMIIPSNDSFFGNDNSFQFELLDTNGQFTGNFSIDLALSDLWDAGTEVNDGLGAAFSANGGTSSDENGVVHAGPDLSNFDQTDTAAGTTINFASASGSPVFRLTVTAVPEPGSAMLLGMFGVGALSFYRRRRC